MPAAVSTHHARAEPARFQSSYTTTGTILAHAPSPGRRLDIASRWQRMASPSGDGVVAELVFERHVHRARNVAALVGGAAVGFGQLPAHVQDRQRLTCVKPLRQLCRADQYLVTSHSSIVPPRLAGVTEHAFSPAERQAVYRVIAERRDMRRFVPGTVVAEEVLARLLQSRTRRAQRRADAAVAVHPDHRRRAAQRHSRVWSTRNGCARPRRWGLARDEFLALKVEGILECAELFVVALGDGRKAHVFGRRTLPQMDLASVSCAIQNLWLAARAEGLGMGWVSIFDPRRLAELLGMPDDAEPVAILCLGPVPEFPDRPALEIDQWAFGRPLRRVRLGEQLGHARADRRLSRRDRRSQRGSGRELRGVATRRRRGHARRGHQRQRGLRLSRGRSRACCCGRAVPRPSGACGSAPRCQLPRPRRVRQALHRRRLRKI